MMQKYSELAFQEAMKEIVAQQAGILIEKVRDDTLVNPEALVLFLTMRFCKTVVCTNMPAATTFGGAKQHIVAQSH